jgi:hypothetical protein
MSTNTPAALRAFAFGDLDTSIWGVAAAWASNSVASFADPVHVAADDEDESILSGAGVELRFVPTGEPAQFEPVTAGLEGSMQICRVEGALHRDGSDHEVACFGARATISLPVAGAGSARAVAAWLCPEDGFALVALRPPRAKGQDTDSLACALFEDGAALAVEEPRLSTTYTDAGIPSRASLELWLAGSGERDDDASDADDPDERTHYPRRVAGERAGDGSDLRMVGLAARAELFRWHARGREGAGVYVLVTAL